MRWIWLKQNFVSNEFKLKWLEKNLMSAEENKTRIDSANTNRNDDQTDDVDPSKSSLNVIVSMEIHSQISIVQRGNGRDAKENQTEKIKGKE